MSKRSIAITQDLLKARDKRISVMTELIGAITFIKVSCFILSADANGQMGDKLMYSFLPGVNNGSSVQQRRGRPR